jgi:plastocyanin
MEPRSPTPRFLVNSRNLEGAKPMTDQTPTEPQDEARADARYERVWREWLGVGVGITALLSILATVVSLVALSSTSKNTTTTVVQAAPAKNVATPPAPKTVKMLVKSDTEHAKRGPDGQWHDAFLPGDFSVKAGQSVTVTVSNYDDAPHSFNSPSLGVNETIGGGSEKAPHAVTFKFKAPSKPGSYEWWCALPCDPWAMSHDGYMRGHVTVIA